MATLGHLRISKLPRVILARLELLVSPHLHERRGVSARLVSTMRKIHTARKKRAVWEVFQKPERVKKKKHGDTHARTRL